MDERKNLPVLATQQVFEMIDNYVYVEKIEFKASMPAFNHTFLKLDEEEWGEEIFLKWDVSDKQDGSIMAWLDEDNTLNISGNGIVLANEDCSYLFSNFTGMKSIVFNDLFDTSNMQTSKGMFLECKELVTVDVADWNTRSLRDASGMFAGCDKLEMMDLSKWNTQNLVNASQMFRGYSELKDVNLSGWNTENLTYVGEMFCNCFELKVVDLSDWNSEKLSGLGGMFWNCENLQKVITSDERIIEEIKEEHHSSSIIQAPENCSIADKMRLMSQGISIQPSQDKNSTTKEKTRSRNNQDISK